MHKNSFLPQEWENPKAVAADHLTLDYRSRAWVTVDHAKLILSCGRTRIYELINEGQLTRVKNGASSRITVASIQQFVSTIESRSPDK